jgi:hypothetical protein
VLVVFAVAVAVSGLVCLVCTIRQRFRRRTTDVFDEQRKALREARQTLRWNRRRAEARGELPPC